MPAKTTFRVLIVSLLICLCCAAAMSQELPSVKNEPECTNPQNLTQWVNCRVYGIAAARINQTGTSKQVEMPSIAANTTSLVDQTEAPDLFGLALNLADLGDEEDSNATAPTITTTAYALYAMTKRQDPLDPAFYQRHAGLRKWSFTVGRDGGKADDDTDDATIFGFKYLIVNKRDASSMTNRTQLKNVSDAVKVAAVNFANVQNEIERYLYAQFGPARGFPDKAKDKDEDEAIVRFVREELKTPAQTQAMLGSLNEAQQKEIMEIIERRIEPAVGLQDAAMEAFEKIRRRPQLSFSFQTKQRRQDGADEYRAGLLYDVGIYQRLNFAANATFDYEDSKIVGGDKRGGRLAVESYFHLNRQREIFSGKDPITLSFQGEGKWMSGDKPTYTGQVKLTFPLFDGVSLPVSFSVANRSDLINESEVRGRFGFTFDFAKLLKGMR